MVLRNQKHGASRVRITERRKMAKSGHGTSMVGQGLDIAIKAKAPGAILKKTGMSFYNNSKNKGSMGKSLAAIGSGPNIKKAHVGRTKRLGHAHFID
jgi:hypothetical protein